MAIEHADSFDIYGTDRTLMTDGVYAQVGNPFGGVLVNDPDGTSQQRVFRFAGSDSPLRYPLQSPESIVGTSLRVWLSSLPVNTSTEPHLFEWRTIDNEVIGYVAVQTTGALKIVAGGVEVATTNFPVITAEAWWHLECLVDVLTGTCEVKVEGETVLDEAGLTFSSDTVYQIAPRNEVSNTGDSITWYLKDYVIWNTLDSENDDFLGPVRVINLRPNEDVELGGWQTVPGGAGWPILDNNPPLPGQYLTASPDAVDAPMQFAMTNLPDDITSIKGVVTFVRARKVDGGYGQMQVSMIGTGDAASDGADRPITAGDVYWRDVHENDPGTGSPWSRVAINASNIRINRTL